MQNDRQVRADDKRERYKAFVTSPKNRRKFIEDLHSFRRWLPELFDESDGLETPLAKGRIRQLMPVPATVYVISENKYLDGKV